MACNQRAIEMGGKPRPKTIKTRVVWITRLPARGRKRVEEVALWAEKPQREGNTWVGNSNTLLVKYYDSSRDPRDPIYWALREITISPSKAYRVVMTIDVLKETDDDPSK